MHQNPARPQQPQLPHQPLRVTLAHESELVTQGFVAMLAPYAARVTVLPADPDGTPAPGADLTLHDFASARQQRRGRRTLVALPHAGLLVAYTWNTRPDLVELALSSGASGCLSKSLGASALVAALEAIHRGDRVVEYGTQPPAETAPQDSLLTPREAEIVALITRGLDNFSIAREASLSINSVKSHIRGAYRKMGVSSRSQAVLWGVRNGFLDEEPTPGEPALTG